MAGIYAKEPRSDTGTAGAGGHATPPPRAEWVTGYAIRSPKSRDAKEMFKNLHDGVDMTTDDTRYPLGYAGLPPRQGLMPDEILSNFDAGFFRMNQKQVDKSDIIMRMLLEVTQEALLDAGLDVASLRGSRTGVYVGHCFSDWLSTSRTDPKLTGYEIVNGAHSMIANRLSFYFDFKGPSLVIDTACSSSSTALHSAHRDLAAGIIDRAVVAGASLTLDPQTNMLFNSFNMLSPTGRCHSFDTRADGYCRSEAIVAVVVEAGRSPMGYCRLAAVSVNSDGSKSEGITYPSRHSQAKNALEAFAHSGLAPRDIGYVEAHGTGTVAGDREELAGLHHVFYGAAGGGPKEELSRIPTELDVSDAIDSDGVSEASSEGGARAIPIGSIKSNLGHTEGASGLVSMVKILMMYEQRTLLPNLHYVKTGHEQLAGGFFAVPTAPAPWVPAPACVSNYGFGGSNAFFVLDPTQTAATSPPSTPSVAEVVIDSAARLAQLRRPLNFGNAPSPPAPVDPEWAARQIAANNHLLYTHRNGEPCTPRSKVCYIFGGQGAQWAGMGKALLASSDIFRQTIERCDAFLQEHGAKELSLLGLFDDGSQWFDARYTSLGITAYQLGVVNILADVGLAPDYYIGHSLGETAAAYAAAAHGTPVASERACILCAYARGRVAFLNKGGKYMVLDDSKPDGVAYEDEPGDGRYALKGKMAAVGLPAATIQQAIDQLGLTQTVVACYNQPAGQTVSGAAVEVDRLHAHLMTEVPNLFFRALDTNEVAYHAKHTRLFEKFLRKEFEAVVPATTMDPRWITTNVDVKAGGSYTTFDAEYLVNNVCNPVYFQSAVESLPPNTLVVEVGSSSSLLGLIKRTRPDLGLLGFAVNKKPESETILADPAALTQAIWQAGHTFAAAAAASKPRAAEKPTTLAGKLPLERRYPDLWDHETKHRTLSFGDFAIAPSQGGGGMAVKYDLGGADKCLLDHVVDGRPLFPAMGHVLTIWRALDPQLERPLLLLDLEVTKPVGLSSDSELEFRVMSHEGKVSVLLADEVVAKARLGAPAATNAPLPAVAPLATTEPTLHAGQIYGAFKRYGYEYADAFQLVEKRSVPGIALGAAELAGSATTADKGGASTARLIAYLDCALQLFLERLGVLRLPTLLRQVHVLPSVVASAASTSTFNMSPSTRDVWSESLRLVELHTLPASARRPVALNCALQRFVPLGVTVLDGVVTETPIMDQVRAICARRLVAMLDAPPATFADAVPPKMAEGLRKMATPYLSVPLTIPEAELAATSAYAEIALNISSRYPEVIGNVYTHITVHEKHMDMYISKPMSLGQYTLSLVGLALQEAPHDDPSIIEIGAGTGGLTRRILDAYSNEISSYLASDCDPIYWSLPKVTTEVYDLNNPPPPNASKAALAVASNAVHTAADMQKSIRHMAARVHAGGHILLEESISDHVCFTWGLDAFAWETAVDTRSYCLWLSWEQYQAVIASIPEVELVAAYKTQTVAAILLRVKETPETVAEHAATPVVTTWQQVAEGACAAEAPKDVVFAGTGARGLQLCLKEEDKEQSLRVRTLTTETDEQAAAAAAANAWPSTLRHGAIANGGTYGSLVRVPFDGVGKGAHPSTVVFRMLSVGDLSSGRWVESPMPTSSPITVAYSGLNFKDLMIASNKLRVEVPALGLEWSGTDSAGTRLMGMTSTGSLAKAIEQPPLVWPVPEGMGLDEAATVPVVYCTVLYALVERARLTAGDSILIHAVSGGIGRAALQIAKSMGLEVYATCAPHKREHVLASCGIAPERLGSSRDASFKNTILTATKGAGVDCVLNSLADELLLAGVECVAEYGHFCEIGKVDFQQNSPLGLAALERNVSFHAIDLAAMFSQPKKQKLLKKLLSDALSAGWVVPLERTTFGCNSVEQALRFMAASKHLGKVLISMDETIAPTSIQHRYVTSGTHLIVGGLGGLGLEMSEWLLANGAASVVLAGRSGVTNGWQTHRIEVMRAAYGEGAIVVASGFDCTDAAACDAFVASHAATLTGVWHCAMNLRDVLFANMTDKQWAECVQVKAAGLANLDASTRTHTPKLQTFMACSSIVAMTGNAGQSNYAYANAAMEAIVRRRLHDGLHGLAVNWGLLDNVGFITTADKEVGAGWLAPQNIDDTLEKLHSMTLAGGVISCIQTRDTSDEAGDVFDEAHLRLKLSGILGGDPSKYDANRTLEQLGIDSLGLVELRNWVRRHCRTASVTTDVTLAALIALTTA